MTGIRLFVLLATGLALCATATAQQPQRPAFVSPEVLAGVPHQSLDLLGPHVMPVFRKQLIELMPRLFR